MEKPTIIAIAGPNGSGKTRYVEQLRRKMATDSVRYVAFCDSYGAQTDRAYYLQLRWNQHDIDQETPTAGASLLRAYSMSGSDTEERRAWMNHLCQTLGLNDLLDKLVITLSSGELRKLQLVKALLTRPHMLMIDNPFIGLDGPTREQLKILLWQLANDEHIIIYIVVARKNDIPEYVHEVKTVGEWDLEREDHRFSAIEPSSAFPHSITSKLLIPQDPAAVVELRHVTIRYSGRTILNDINWTINKGERWALSGRNGSGKSTLLSLISADNPQAYACDISLFGRQRGSGETIWDIKRHIGYVSPEMHRSYQRNLPAIQIVASGLKDTVGLYVRPNEAEKEQCRRWMRMFCLEGREEQPFLTMSSGEQRLVLLARAFVKEPALLILDEPMHGLDEHNEQMVKDIINDYFQQPDKTLIMVSHYEEELPTCITHRKFI